MTTPTIVTILGSGTSTGVPVIGCDCAVCLSQDPKDYRTRASLLLDFPAGERIIIDTGPDFRAQALRAGIRALSAVFYTHTHADHCHGFDDLRALFFRAQTPIDCYLDPVHLQELSHRFAYAFKQTDYLGTKPQVQFCPITSDHFRAGHIEVDSLTLPHGGPFVRAFRFGSFAYATDFKAFDDEAVGRWKGKVQTMVASGIRPRPHPTHSSIGETIAVFEKLGVQRGILNHLSHDVSYAEWSKKLPHGVELAYDGLRIEPSQASR